MQALRGWYERLTEFLTINGYKKGRIDKTLYVTIDEGKLMVSQIYVDDIVYGGMSDSVVEHNVQTCVLEHMVSGNRQMVLQFWFKIIISKI